MLSLMSVLHNPILQFYALEILRMLEKGMMLIESGFSDKESDD